MRKPWMNKLQSYKFTGCGTMTADTRDEWRNAGDIWPACDFDYARAMGISIEEARTRIAAQKARIEGQNDPL